jgi:hypothetical protein
MTTTDNQQRGVDAHPSSTRVRDQPTIATIGGSNDNNGNRIDTVGKNTPTSTPALGLLANSPSTRSRPSIGQYPPDVRSFRSRRRRQIASPSIQYEETSDGVSISDGRNELPLSTPGSMLPKQASRREQGEKSPSMRISNSKTSAMKSSDKSVTFADSFLPLSESSSEVVDLQYGRLNDIGQASRMSPFSTEKRNQETVKKSPTRKVNISSYRDMVRSSDKNSVNDVDDDEFIEDPLLQGAMSQDHPSGRKLKNEEEDEILLEISSPPTSSPFASGAVLQHPQPTLSIMNIIIDYYMSDPTPLSWDEFEQVQRYKLRDKLKDLAKEGPSPDANYRNDDNPIMIQIPVVRIFGPLLKHSHSSIVSNVSNNSSTISAALNTVPCQNGCVHIHNAFPYLVARPTFLFGQVHRKNDTGQGIFSQSRVASNAESLEHGTDDGSDDDPSKHLFYAMSESINWFNFASIYNSLDLLTEYLEQLCVEIQLARRMHNFNKQDEDANGSGGDRRAISPLLPRCIRQVTVVSGRAFYTFDPNPPGFFLRIEYYNPQDRHLIRTLLQGRQQKKDNDSNTNGTRSAMSAENTFRFQCFEAHIPYTMQFFKDYNLAGMNYINFDASGNKVMRHDNGQYKTGNGVVGGRRVLFRTPLPASSSVPKKARTRLDGSLSSSESNATSAGSNTTNPDNYFLLDNTPSHFMWEDSLKRSELSSATDQPLQDTSVADESSEATREKDVEEILIKHYDPPQKVTNCHRIVEFDVSVNSILNVNQVMTPDEITSTQAADEQKQVHWRAVPSLKEIWQEEKLRMAHLLRDAPEDNFLLEREIDRKKRGGARALNEEDELVKKLKSEERIPGTREALKGVMSLYESDLDNSSNEHHQNLNLQGIYHAAMKDIVTRHEKEIEKEERAWASSLSPPTSPPVEQTLFPGSSNDNQPSSNNDSQNTEDQEVLDTLMALGDQFADSKNAEVNTPLSKQDGPRKQVGFSFTTQGNTLSQSSLGIEATTPRSTLSQGGLGIQNMPRSFFNVGSTQLSARRPQTSPPNITQLTREAALRTQTQIEDEMRLEHIDDLADDGEEEEDDDHLEEPETEDSLAMLLKDFDVDDDRSAATGRGQKQVQRSGSFKMEDEMFNDGVSFTMNYFDANHVRSPHRSLTRASSNAIENLTSRTQQSQHRDLGSQARHSSGAYEDREGKPAAFPFGAVFICAGGPPLPSDVVPWTEVTDPSKALGYLGEFSKLKKHIVHDPSPFVPPISQIWTPIAAPPRPCLLWSKLKGYKKRVARFDQEKSLSKKRRMAEKEKHNTKVKPNRRSKANNQATTMEGKSVFGAVEDVFYRARRTSQQSQAADVDKALSLSPPLTDLSHFSGGPRDQLQSVSSDKQSSPLITSHSSTTQNLQSLAAEKFGATQHSFSTQWPKRAPSAKNHDPLQGLGNQGGKLHVEGGGLKVSRQAGTSASATSRPGHPITILSVEIHVQCRIGKTSLTEGKEIAMTPDSERDAVASIVYIFAVDPGGGQQIEFIDQGCLYVPVGAELHAMSDKENPTSGPGAPFAPRKLGLSRTKVEQVSSERSLFHRFVSVVRTKDPDILLSWDTHGAGIGYLVKRGAMLGKETTREGDARASPIDMARLLGRTPRVVASKRNMTDPSLASLFPTGDEDASSKDGGAQHSISWRGSGLGVEWDDKKGAGAAAASIVGRLAWCGWKITSEEIKHPLASYQPAMASTVLKKRLPSHDGLILNRWYGADRGRERWRVVRHRLDQASATLLVIDELDLIGRTGETAR